MAVEIAFAVLAFMFVVVVRLLPAFVDLRERNLFGGIDGVQEPEQTMEEFNLCCHDSYCRDLSRLTVYAYLRVGSCL